MLRLLILVLFCTYTVLGAEYHKDENTCPEHWTDGSLVDMGCLLFDSSTTYSWTNASYFCQDSEGGNGSLVEIENQQQMDYVLMMLTLLSDHEDAATRRTSGTDLGRENNWYWSNSLKPVEDFVWYAHGQAHEPNGGLDSNCLSMYASLGYEGATEPCSALYFPICQRK